MAESVVSKKMISCKSNQDFMRKKLEEWRKTKALKNPNEQLKNKNPLKRTISQNQKPKQPLIRRSVSYGLSSRPTKENNDIRRKTISMTKNKLSSNPTKCNKEISKKIQPKADEFHGNLSNLEENNSHSRRSTFTKDENIFCEIVPDKLQIETEPEAKKSRRSTFTLESPYPRNESKQPTKLPHQTSKPCASSRVMQNKRHKQMKQNELIKRNITQTKPRKMAIKDPLSKSAITQSSNGSVAKKYEQKTLPNQSSKKLLQQKMATKKVMEEPKASHAKPSSSNKEKSLSMRKRLEMWRKEKGKPSECKNTVTLHQRKKQSKTGIGSKKPLVQDVKIAVTRKKIIKNKQDFTSANKALEECADKLKMPVNSIQEKINSEEIEKYQGDQETNFQPQEIISNKADLNMCEENKCKPSEITFQTTPFKQSKVFVSPSSTIRYSVTKATPHRSRISKTCERPTVTPVRRSIRLERRSVYYPTMLQDHNLTVKHLDEIPQDIKDDISFKPNFSVNSELNDVWKEIMDF